VRAVAVVGIVREEEEEDALGVFDEMSCVFLPNTMNQTQI
jgi:hypothetical protein